MRLGLDPGADIPFVYGQLFEAQIHKILCLNNAAGMIAGEAPLVGLAEGLEAALRGRGFDRADQRFSAHLTIGRVRNPGDDWIPRLAAFPAAAGAATRFRVDRLLLMESKLSPKGSTYTIKAEARLPE